MSSNTPESDLDLDLHFLPAWAQQSPTVNRYANYEGGGAEESRSRRGDRPDRPGSRDRRDRPERRGPRPEGGPPRRDLPSPGGQRPGAGGGDLLKWEAGREGPPRRGRWEERRESLPPLPDVDLTVIPDEHGVESLARQIKLTGRAYPLFDIGYLILKKPERYHVQFDVVRKPDGQPAQPLWSCNLDDTVWLAETEAVNHVLKKHFDMFYQTEKMPTDPPKGTYTFVAQCGLSGVVLGPPNYHDYQNKLRKLHSERFARMPFEVFKSRVKIVRDEAVVKQWLEEQSYRTEYLGLNVPDPVRFASREEVEKHFRETHLPNIIKQVERYTPPTPEARDAMPRLLQIVMRHAVEDQRRFPLRMVTLLSQQFAAHGLQFFKVNKTVTHVAVARPHFLDMTATPVSQTVRRIVEFINANPKCTRRRLLEALAPVTPAPAPTASAELSPAAPAAPAAEAPPVSPEANAIIGDLHWLIHQGHVIEFANGMLETAKPPPPRPVKPRPQPQPTSEGAPKAVPSAPDPGPTASMPPEGTPAEGAMDAPGAEVMPPPEAIAAPGEPIPPVESTPEPAPPPAETAATTGTPETIPPAPG